MERLRQKDLLALLEFIKEGYAICDLDTFVHRVISGLAKIVPSDITTYNEFHPRRQRNIGIWNPSAALSSQLKEAFDQRIRDHPLITHHQKTRDNRAFKISDFLTRRQFHRRGLYNEFFRHFDVEDQIALGLSSAPSLTVGIALNRGRDFTERDRLLLNLLGPHFIQAYRNAEAVTQMQQKLALASQVMDKLELGVIVQTRDGRTRMVNQRAQQLVEDYFGSRSLKADRLPEALDRWAREQEWVLRREDEVPSPREPLVVEREAKRLVVRYLCDPAQCLLLFDEQQTAPAPQALECLGLSQREGEILAWVVQGKTNAEIGTILGLSPRTVQKHLEHIYQKLGVENRTAAAAKAYETTSITSG